ncbi:MAG: ornithine carbamoyltransferase, partial [Syntrophobacteraceae bacterium]
QISRKEPLADMARVLERYIDAIVVRTYGQEEVEELARYASIPVVNALTDHSHPCQVLADLMTILEKRGSFEDLTVAWIGDGNNVANSWIYAAARLGFTLTLACPAGYEPDPDVLAWAEAQGKGRVLLIPDALKAVAGAEVIYTDVWASMGQEAEAQSRQEAFKNYQVNSELVAAAPS